jgi:hypothetical protein
MSIVNEINSNYQNSPEHRPSSIIRRVKNFDELDNIRLAGDSEEIKMGDCLQLVKNDTVSSYSYNANPCICGVVETNNKDVYMFHSVADILTDEQEEVIKNSRSGIVGGGQETLEKFSSLLHSSGIKIIPPSSREDDFSIVFIKGKNQFDVTPGIYFCYDVIPDDYLGLLPESD